MRGAGPLRPRGRFIQGRWSLPPPVGLPGPHPGFLSFHDERNQRRAGAAPLDPLRGTERKVFHFSLPLPLRCPHPLDRVSASDPDRFATLRKVSKLVLFFSPGVAGVTPSSFKPWHGGWTNWRLTGAAITIRSHRYDTFTATNGQTLSPSLYYYIISFI